MNTVLTEPTLNNENHYISYNLFRKVVVYEIVKVAKKVTETNVYDLLTNKFYASNNLIST